MIVSKHIFEQKPLLGKIRITSNLVVKTGIHIGGGGETLDIGGLDKPVIRNPLSRHPYLPGSSIKGKLRSILERFFNKPLNRPGGSNTYRYESDDLIEGYTEIKQNNSPILIRFDGARNCEISRVFGSTGVDCWVKSDIVIREGLELVANIQPRIIIKSADPKNRFARFETSNNEIKEGEIREEYVKVKGRNSTARIIIRDSHLDDKSIKKLERADTGLYMTEWKFENGIDRVTAAANPRQVERVPAGSVFNFELVYTVEDENQVVKDLENIAIALAILEDDALGGHGSRGYGKIRFQNFGLFYRNLKQYQDITESGSDFNTPIQTAGDTTALLDNFGNLSSEINRRLPSTNEE